MPTVVAAAAAPAEAASPLPRIDRVFSIRRATTAAVPGASVSACGSGSTRLSVTTDDVNTYYRIANVQAGSTVTNVTASVLVQKDMVDAMGSRNPLTWTSATTDWSTPVREVSGTGSPVLYTNNGTRYYRYVSKLSTPVPAPVSGTITLPRIGWYSNCSTTLAGVSVSGRGSAVVNGMTLDNVGDFRTL
ncbi:hypothetical protein QP516_04710 [Micrococcus luteus]|uniref:hypothetical protein n=1 Tax=Micrococcus luteus TaxID=1270 RepID=UPI0011AF185F|nr:hypothetical protein [Micrococcus luteus]MCT1857580.1 hypothetical protein [Micrococcus luteus]MCV7727239.1 hypothetical protein [Micrococcus luteus]MDK7329074.1 hypothetical protein [Micrococcus luteus]